MTDSANLNILNFVFGKNLVLFPLPRAIKIFAVLTTASFYLNLFLGCSYTFTCSSFVPSPHYLGSFLGFNRFYVVSIVLLTMTVSLLYLGIYLEVKFYLSKHEDLAIKIANLGTCASLPLMALTNEINSSHFVNFHFVFLALAYLCLAFNLAWLAIVGLKFREKVSVRSHLRFCAFWLCGLAGLWVLVLIQQVQNYKTENWFINTTIWSALEWMLLTGQLVFIGLLSDFTRSFKVLIGNSKKDQSLGEHIELEQLSEKQ